MRDHLFVSYATEDAAFVEWLSLKLASEGYRVWCDRTKLLGGESYPLRIDEAIKEHSARFLAVLSRSSLQKPNPLKERTLALNLMHNRNEEFVIPINLDGVTSTDLDWMHSDLTFIPFHQGWAQGLGQLLAKLEQAVIPKSVETGRSAVRDWFTASSALLAKRERIWSSLAEILETPKSIYRFELGTEVTDSGWLELLKAWPHFRENRTVCWSFQHPAFDLREEHGLASRGTIEDWRAASSPDINARNIAVRVFNASLRSLGLSRGLLPTPDAKLLHFPWEVLPANRLRYAGYDGTRTWIQVAGLRSFKTTSGTEVCRYHLAPALRVHFDRYAVPVVRSSVRLYLTTNDGTPLPPGAGLRRRKAICRNWWNHEWLCRTVAHLQFLADDKPQIVIGTERGQQLVVSKYPMTFWAERGIDETVLGPAPPPAPTRLPETEEEEILDLDEDEQGDADVD